ncbi:MAG: dUTP diphosphatase [Candidatus Nealsonbacteria bacterium]|nr:dUTP diphosphatase [Candidatus Nealsonbacteria bacterium]
MDSNKVSNRPSWEEFWFNLALFYSTRGTCDRLKAACLLVDKNNRLIGAGYNGSLPGHPHCDEVGHLMVDGHCLRTLHAEVNAIMHSVGDLEGATAYVLGTPCIDCVKKLLAKKIGKIVFTRDYDNKSRGGEYIFELAKLSGVEIYKSEIDFENVFQKNIGILKNPGGALFKEAPQAGYSTAPCQAVLASAANSAIRVQKMNPEAKLPSFAYEGDAGMDLFSCEDCKIEPLGKETIGTGLKIAVPAGFAGFVWDKSGLALNHSLTTLAGVLDSGYRGELKVILMNLGKEPYGVKKGQKIAQLVIKKIEKPEIIEDNLDETERGEKGFGSSGLI